MQGRCGHRVLIGHSHPTPPTFDHPPPKLVPRAASAPVEDAAEPGRGGGSRWSGKLRRGRKMKGGRVRRSCFASLHVSPASFPPSSFLRTQRRARSRRRRRPVKPPVSPHRTPPCLYSPPTLPLPTGGTTAGTPGCRRLPAPRGGDGSDGGGRDREERGGRGVPARCLGPPLPMEPPENFPRGRTQTFSAGKVAGRAGGPDLLRAGVAAQRGPRAWR